MPVDYVEVLRDLDAQIAFHESEAEALRVARPGIVKLRNAVSAKSVFAPPAVTSVKYAGMGNFAAIRLLMSDGQLRTRDEIYDQLRLGGFTSDAANPVGSVGASLSQMKDELERVEDRWRKKTLTESVQTFAPRPVTLPPLASDAPTFEDWQKGLASNALRQPSQQ